MGLIRRGDGGIDVDGISDQSGDKLQFGDIADGEFVKREGDKLVGATAGGGSSAYTYEVLDNISGSGNVVDPDVEFTYVSVASSCSASMANGSTDGQPKTIVVQYNGTAARNFDVTGAFMDTPEENGGVAGESIRFKSMDDLSVWNANILHMVGSFRWSADASAWIKTTLLRGGGSVNYPS